MTEETDLQPDESPEEVSLPARVRRLLPLLALALLSAFAANGLVSALMPGWGLPQLDSRDLPRVLEVRGRLTFEGPYTPANYNRVVMTFLLPEVPAQWTETRNDLHFNAVGDFVVQLRFLSRQVPQVLNVRAACPGWRPRKLPAQKLDSGEELKVTVEPIRLEKLQPTVEDKAVPLLGPRH